MLLSNRARIQATIITAIALFAILFIIPDAQAAEPVRTVAILSQTAGLSPGDRALTRGLNTIITFKLEAAPGVRIVPETEIEAAGTNLDIDEIWKSSEKAIGQAATILTADIIISGRHRTQNGSVSAEFRICTASGKIACKTLEKKTNKNSAAAMQKSLAGTVAGAVDAKLSKAVLAMPYTDNSKALDAFIQGIDLLARGQNADAFKSLQKADAADPAFRDLWYFMGKHYASREFNYEKAISYLNKTLASYPDDPAAHYWLGFAYYLQGATAPAIRAFETTVKLKPASYDSYVYLAMLNKDLGEYQKVENYYRKALEYTPNNAAAWYNLAGIQAQMNKPKEAVASLRRALSINCPVFLDIVRTDSDFASIRKTDAFINTLREFAKKCK